jgi:phospho-N-acetylmuramoyl-pentapeptide-transferase
MDQVQNFFRYIPGGDTLSILILYFIGTSILAFILSPLIINTLFRLKITRTRKGDNEIATQLDEQKGKIGTPIMGGLIVIISVFLITVIFNWRTLTIDGVRYSFTYLPIGAMILAACIGGIDDLLNVFGKNRLQPKPIGLHLKLMRVHKVWWKRILYFFLIPWAIFSRLMLFLGSKPKSGLQVHEKLLLQAIVGITVGLWVYLKNENSTIWIPYLLQFDWFISFINFFPFFIARPDLNSVDIGWLMVPFITLVIMTISNSVNFSDGMDGLAGGLLLISFAAYSVIAFNISEYGSLIGNQLVYGNRAIAYLSASAAGALLAYLYFNVKPARVQMGDVGSLGIGTLLSVIAVVLDREFTLLLIAGMFLLNGVFSRLLQAFWKKVFKRRLFRFIPLHYHFEAKGWPEEKVVMRFMIISLILTAFGVYLAGI